MKLTQSIIFLFFYCYTVFPQIPDSLIRDEGDTVWYDIRCFNIEGRGWAESGSFFDRLPMKAKEIVPEKVWTLSHNSAGLYTKFATDAKSFRVKWTLNNSMIAMAHMPASGVSGIDIYRKLTNGEWFYYCTGKPILNPTNNVSIKDSLSNGEEVEYLLYFPLYNGISKLEIGIPKGKSIRKVIKDVGKPIVFYGTSITQGGCASRPGLVHTALLHRWLNVPVINLGFSGSGKMEIEMAQLLSEIDASVYILDCLRNMNTAMVLERTEKFIRYIRKNHPSTPILMVEDSDYSMNLPTERGEEYLKIYNKLRKEGDEQLYYLEGKDLLGSDGEGTVDGVHPNDIGFMRQAIEFEKAIKKISNPVEKYKRIFE